MDDAPNLKATVDSSWYGYVTLNPASLSEISPKPSNSIAMPSNPPLHTALFQCCLHFSSAACTFPVLPALVQCCLHFSSAHRTFPVLLTLFQCCLHFSSAACTFPMLPALFQCSSHFSSAHCLPLRNAFC